MWPVNWWTCSQLWTFDEQLHYFSFAPNLLVSRLGPSRLLLLLEYSKTFRPVSGINPSLCLINNCFALNSHSEATWSRCRIHRRDKELWFWQAASASACIEWTVCFNGPFVWSSFSSIYFRRVFDSSLSSSARLDSIWDFSHCCSFKALIFQFHSVHVVSRSCRLSANVSHIRT